MSLIPFRIKNFVDSPNLSKGGAFQIYGELEAGIEASLQVTINNEYMNKSSQNETKNVMDDPGNCVLTCR